MNWIPLNCSKMKKCLTLRENFNIILKCEFIYPLAPDLMNNNKTGKQQGGRSMKTFMPKAAEISRKWYVVDAEGKTLGRLASEVAKVLRGKNKPTFTPHADMGDFVIVVNADKVVLTGNKLDQKYHYHHTGYPGGLKSVKYRDLLKNKPEEVVMHAVKGMLPKNSLGRQTLKKLRVYRGAEHPHAAQKPETMELNIQLG